MLPNPAHPTTLPVAQQRIRAQCYHPTGTFIPFPKQAIEQSIPERFTHIACQFPDRLAVKTYDHALTYAELNQAANRVAHAIAAQCGGGNEPVALLFAQGIVAVIAILGTLKAGKCYVPLDASYPVASLASMLKDTGATLLLTDHKYNALATQLAHVERLTLTRAGLSAPWPDHNPEVSTSPDDYAYIFYTSGSTGHPKGVVDNHRNVLHNVMRYTNSLHICAEDRLTLLHSCSSSATVSSLFSAVLNGATVYPFDLHTEGLHRIAPWLNQENLTIYHSTPVVFRSMTANRQAVPSLRLLRLEGDQACRRDIELYKLYCARDCILVNGLGATESGLVRQYFVDRDTVVTGSLVPIGYPVEDMEISVGDEHGKCVSPSTVGEIVITSNYLALGYWNRPELAAARFTRAPEDDSRRVYYTGDLGCIDADGCLLHLGRKDCQVKIRGTLVACADVEMALRQIAYVKDAAVMAVQDHAGAQRLVGYIVSESQYRPSMGMLRSSLADLLPDFMIPSTFMFLEKLPLMSGGKVDRRALPAPTYGRPWLDVAFVAPTTPLEATLATIWSTVLGLDQVGRHDHFLDVGGDSLLATQILVRVIETCQVDVPLHTLFETPTVAQMAVVIAKHLATQTDAPIIARLLTEVETFSEDNA